MTIATSHTARNARFVDSRRDGAVTAGILGCFATAWFSWGQADATGAIGVALTVGSAVALVVAVLGAIGALRLPRAGGAMHDRAVRRRYGIVVAVEFIVAGLGAAALGATGVSDYVPVWVCAVVGLHFFALAAVLDAAGLRWLGAGVSAVAVEALLVGVLTTTAPAIVTAAGAGLALLVSAMLMLAGTITRAPARRGDAA